MRLLRVPASVTRDSYTAAAFIGGIAAGLVIGGYGVLQLFAVEGPGQGVVAFFDLALAALCGAVAAAAARGRLDTVARQDVAMLVVIVAIAVGIVVESLVVPARQDRLTAHFLMTLTVSGVVLRRWGWHVSFLALAIVIWIAVHGPHESDVLRWLPTMVVAAGISVCVHMFVATLYTTAHSRELDAQASARKDTLTGLNNRLGLHDHLRTLTAVSRRNRQPLWCAFLDVDHFKLVNDTFGHEAGDHLLVAVAHALESVAREADAAARWGGDEFVLIGLGEAPDADALQARLGQALVGRNPLAHRGWSAAVTVGIAATGPAPDDDDVADLLTVADENMYHRRGIR